MNHFHHIITNFELQKKLKLPPQNEQQNGFWVDFLISRNLHKNNKPQNINPKTKVIHQGVNYLRGGQFGMSELRGKMQLTREERENILATDLQA